MAAIEITFLDKSSAKIFPAIVRIVGLLSKVTSDIDVTNFSCFVRIIEDSFSDSKKIISCVKKRTI